MSISKAQARALADGFLNNLGSDADAFEPRESYTEIIVLAGELVEMAQDNLIKSHSISSGKLSESIVANEPTSTGNILQVEVLMLFYGQFVNSGVRGTKSGSGKYVFKNDGVSKKMVENIQKWIKRSSLQVRNKTVQKQTHGGLEKKRKSISQLNLGRQVAYAVARSIKQHGIKPTGFMDNAINTTASRVQDRLGEALEVDIINSLQ